MHPLVLSVIASAIVWASSLLIYSQEQKKERKEKNWAVIVKRTRICLQQLSFRVCFMWELTAVVVLIWKHWLYFLQAAGLSFIKGALCFIVTIEKSFFSVELRTFLLLLHSRSCSSVTQLSRQMVKIYYLLPHPFSVDFLEVIIGR